MENPESVSQSPNTVSTVQEIREKILQNKLGTIVELPSGICVRLARPSLPALLRAGKVPSSLIGVALKQSQGASYTSIKEVTDALEVVDILLVEAFKEPVLVLKDAGEGQICVSDLSDEDRSYALQYIQTGKQDLTPFREKSNK